MPYAPIGSSCSPEQEVGLKLCALRLLVSFCQRSRSGRPPRAENLEFQPPYHASGIDWAFRSEEHTSELQSLMRNSYAVFCLQKKTPHTAYIILPQYINGTKTDTHTTRLNTTHKREYN